MIHFMLNARGVETGCFNLKYLTVNPKRVHYNLSAAGHVDERTWKTETAFVDRLSFWRSPRDNRIDEDVAGTVDAHDEQLLVNTYLNCRQTDTTSFVHGNEHVVD